MIISPLTSKHHSSMLSIRGGGRLTLVGITNGIVITSAIFPQLTAMWPGIGEVTNWVTNHQLVTRSSTGLERV